MSRWWHHQSGASHGQGHQLFREETVMRSLSPHSHPKLLDTRAVTALGCNLLSLPPRPSPLRPVSVPFTALSSVSSPVPGTGEAQQRHAREINGPGSGNKWTRIPQHNVMMYRDAQQQKTHALSQKRRISMRMDNTVF